MKDIPIVWQDGLDPGRLVDDCKRWLEEAQPEFSANEQRYIEQWVKKIELATQNHRLGSYNIADHVVRLYPYAAGTLHSPYCESARFTLVHELAHALYTFAGQDGYGGFLVIDPALCTQAQQRLQEKFPDAIAKMDAALKEGISALKALDRTQFSREESVATQLYQCLDDRYYATRGYPRPSHPHEIACNLRALSACENVILGVSKDKALVKDIAAPIFDVLDRKFAAAYERDPTRPPALIGNKHHLLRPPSSGV